MKVYIAINQEGEVVAEGVDIEGLTETIRHLPNYDGYQELEIFNLCGVIRHTTEPEVVFVEEGKGK